MLLGSVCVKAARNTLMKSIQGEGERERLQKVREAKKLMSTHDNTFREVEV